MGTNTCDYEQCLSPPKMCKGAICPILTSASDESGLREFRMKPHITNMRVEQMVTL